MTRSRRNRWALSVLITSVVVGCQLDRSVGLEFAPTLRVAGALSGFHCTDVRIPERGLPMLEHLPSRLASHAVGDTAPACLVLDFIRLNGTPSCRGFAVLDWCAERGCAPVASARARIDLNVAAPGLRSSDDAWSVSLANAIRAAGGSLVSADAPDESVIIRAVALAGPCGATPDTESLQGGSLLGCAYSCPVTLDDVGSGILLDLSTGASNLCGPYVNACAGVATAPAGRM